ncbi:MAG: hypothetical protein VB085_04330 [Peptococcaceae bacterium]|nr:hypothetical protein [Peptococcaceae bacterium]
MAAAYLPWDSGWRELITYIPWVQPEGERMEDSPMLPAYPVFKNAENQGLEGRQKMTAVAGAMVTVLGHQPDDPLAPLYSVWLSMYDPNLARQLLLEGTDLASRFDFGEAVWMLQAAVMLEPESYEAHYNLALTYEQLGRHLQRQKKLSPAHQCFALARQYRENAAQLEQVRRVKERETAPAREEDQLDTRQGGINP